MSDAVNRSLLCLTTLVQLEKRARHAGSPEELGFLIVNETHGLVRYRQAALWLGAAGRGRVAALSGLAQVEREAPFVVWLARLFAGLERTGDRTLRPVEATTAPGDCGRDWRDFLPERAFWLPLDRPGGGDLGAVLFARDEPFATAESHLLGYLGDAYGHAAAALADRRPRRRWFARDRRLGWLAALACAGLSLVPVRQSVLAPAEVVAERPSVVRAPVDGVVDRFHVQPNESVEDGQALLTLDPAQLQNRRAVALKAREVAEAEYRQAAQLAVTDPRSKASMAVLKGRLEQHQAEVAYLEELLARIEIKAPRRGIAVFDDVNDWIGRPVKVGERILMVADPQEMELEIRLPVADAIVLTAGAPVQLFLNTDPQHPVPGTLISAGYQATVGPDSILAYRLKAGFDTAGVETPALRIGLNGTAKVYGEQTTLFYYVLRRPLAAARQWFGL